MIHPDDRVEIGHAFVEAGVDGYDNVCMRYEPDQGAPCGYTREEHIGTRSLICRNGEGHWPSEYSSTDDRVTEITHSLMAHAGIAGDDKDTAGDDVLDTLCTELKDIMFRSPKLMILLENLDNLLQPVVIDAIAAHRNNYV